MAIQRTYHSDVSVNASYIASVFYKYFSWTLQVRNKINRGNRLFWRIFCSQDLSDLFSLCSLCHPPVPSVTSRAFNRFLSEHIETGRNNQHIVSLSRFRFCNFSDGGKNENSCLLRFLCMLTISWWSKLIRITLLHCASQHKIPNFLIFCVS